MIKKLFPFVFVPQVYHDQSIPSVFLEYLCILNTMKPGCDCGLPNFRSVVQLNNSAWLFTTPCWVSIKPRREISRDIWNSRFRRRRCPQSNPSCQNETLTLHRRTSARLIRDWWWSAIMRHHQLMAINVPLVSICPVPFVSDMKKHLRCPVNTND